MSRYVEPPLDDVDDRGWGEFAEFDISEMWDEFGEDRGSTYDEAYGPPLHQTKAPMIFLPGGISVRGMPGYQGPCYLEAERSRSRDRWPSLSKKASPSPAPDPREVLWQQQEDERLLRKERMTETIRRNRQLHVDFEVQHGVPYPAMQGLVGELGVVEGVSIYALDVSGDRWGVVAGAEAGDAVVLGKVVLDRRLWKAHNAIYRPEISSGFSLWKQQFPSKEGAATVLAAYCGYLPGDWLDEDSGNLVESRVLDGSAGTD